MRLLSGRPKTVTTPEIIDQIHELILEDRRISAKSIAEQPGISREQVGSIINIPTTASETLAILKLGRLHNARRTTAHKGHYSKE